MTYLQRNRDGSTTELEDVAFLVRKSLDHRRRVFMGRLITEKKLNERRRIAQRLLDLDADVLLVEEVEDKTALEDFNSTSTSIEYVTRKLRALGLEGRARPVRGYLEQTLPTLAGRYCLAFIDCDLRDSLTFCAQDTWDKLVPSGRMVFDDYSSEQYRAAAEAVDEFVGDHSAELAAQGDLAGMYHVVRGR